MEDNKRLVPAVVIKRLPRYYRYLSDLKRQDIKRISSKALSQKMGVTASQIRQDFNYFGGFGQQGYGYSVDYLHNGIGEILGLSEGYKAIIVGAGNLGHALANHKAFQKRGFKISAIFDRDERLVGEKINGIEVISEDLLESYVAENKIEIAILAVPKESVQKLADKLVDAGVKGLWNFSYTEIKTKKPVAIENVHLSDSLMTLSYKIKNNK